MMFRMNSLVISALFLVLFSAQVYGEEPGAENIGAPAEVKEEPVQTAPEATVPSQEMPDSPNEPSIKLDNTTSEPAPRVQ
jgi:hypothetical protein